MSDRVNQSKHPLVGGNYSGLWVKGKYVTPVTAQPVWRTNADGTALGWLDPSTDVHIPPVHPAGIGAGS